MEVNAEIEKYVNSSILPRYESFDAAHGITHIMMVIAESLRLAQHFDVNIDMVYVIAAYHDLGLTQGRDNHHTVSAEILLADLQLLQWFTPSQIAVMAQAVEDHRASSKHVPRTIYGKIVAEADRDIDPMTVLLRAVQYGINHCPAFTPEEQFTRFRTHIHEKYGEGGYLKLWIPFSDNAAGLARLREMLCEEEPLRRIFNDLYNREIALR